MKILSASQIREADRYTIEHEPVSSIDLMERASSKLFQWILSRFEAGTRFYLFCGKGNNGGDGLALGRMLANENFHVTICIVEYSPDTSADFAENLKRLRGLKVSQVNIKDEGDFPSIPTDAVIVDAIFGSGLNRPLEGLPKTVVTYLNKQDHFKISIDIPSGLFADDNEDNDLTGVFRADQTLTFQLPKRAFFNVLMAPLVGEVEVLDIGLNAGFIESETSKYYHFEGSDASQLFKPRRRFSYKGSYGHALLLAGSRGKTGAAVIASKSCLKGGAGLLTVSTSASGMNPLQTAIPDAMVLPDNSPDHISELPKMVNYNAIGIGPGIGTHEDTQQLVKGLIGSGNGPLVLDADALNILAENPTWLSFLPPGSILTPHPGEFKRLLGVKDLDQSYWRLLSEFAQKHQVIVILKDSISTVAGAGGRLFLINSGSPALATAGSGDALTGLVLAFLANGYPSIDAALMATFVHARAGYLAGVDQSLESVLASEIPDYYSRVFREFYS